MRRCMFFVGIAMLLIGCSTTNRYGLADGVSDYGGGQYYVTGLSVPFFHSAHGQALTQCNMDGGKQLQVVNSSFTTGFSGDVFPALVFKCVGVAKPPDLTATQQVNNQNFAKSDTAAKNAELKQKNDQLNTKITAMCSSEELKEFYKKTPCKVTEISFEQIADTSKITQAQKNALIKQRKLQGSLENEQDEMFKLYGEVGLKAISIWVSFLRPEAEKNAVALYNGNITWGDYNKKRRENYLESERRRKQ